MCISVRQIFNYTSTLNQTCPAAYYFSPFEMHVIVEFRNSNLFQYNCVDFKRRKIGGNTIKLQSDMSIANVSMK